MSANMTNGPTPEEARALLAQAAQSEATTKAGSSWPQVAGLLSLGASSSLALPAIAYAPSDLLMLPMILMIFWITVSFVFIVVFSRSVKRGFGKRWIATVATWGVLWVLGIVGTSTWFAGDTWFLAAICAALTAVAVIGAWIEARR